MNGFPHRRMRRLRNKAALRALRRETRVSPDALIYPLFVVEDAAAAGPVTSMPGVLRHTLDSLRREVDLASRAGVSSVLLFGVPAKKDAQASRALDASAIVARAVECVRVASADMAIITDVCLCSYTDHGHCGVVHGKTVDNDRTLELLGKMAVVHAQAGADVVAPSGMMDGMVSGIRAALDANGLAQTGILSYAVKYASSFYGPFREAAESSPEFGDRRGYQMDPANVREALAEARLDVHEGADMLMVKPALPYLDVVRAVRETFPEMPLAAYQVSGEYSMIKAAAERGWLDEKRVAMESLTAIRRAGADAIITYYAKDAAGWCWL